jgi:hypothetical protein
MLLRDLLLVAENARYLPRLFASSAPTNGDFRLQYSEVNYLRESVTATQLIKGMVTGQGIGTPRGASFFLTGESYDKSEHWFFVNGVAVDADLAMQNAICLSEIFKRQITVVHNPTHGLLPDLIECVFERTLDQSSPISIDLYNAVMDALLNGEKVKVIGHSQGGIIASRLLYKLQCLDFEAFKNLEIYTFGSGADESVAVKGVKQEHFANSDDFVARIGITKAQADGDVYVRKEIGHLLNRDYLEHFVGGHFCGGKSRLYSYLKVAK